MYFDGDKQQIRAGFRRAAQLNRLPKWLTQPAAK